MLRLIVEKVKHEEVAGPNLADHPPCEIAASDGRSRA